MPQTTTTRSDSACCPSPAWSRWATPPGGCPHRDRVIPPARIRRHHQHSADTTERCFVNTSVGTDGPVADLLLRGGRFFGRGEVSADLRTVSKTGGREGDVFYRDRWSHDKVVRSTHGVNCTGSCSWKVYVKDGIITWETQETDYPTVGPDRPDYE